MKENNFKELKKRRFDVSQAMQNSSSEHSYRLVYSINLGNQCYYHPSREALTKCEHCGEIICVECRTIYRGDVILGYPDEELCFQCKVTKTRVVRTFDLFMYILIVVGFIVSMTGAFLFFATKIRSA